MPRTRAYCEVLSFKRKPAVGDQGALIAEKLTAQVNNISKLDDMIEVPIEDLFHWSFQCKEKELNCLMDTGANMCLIDTEAAAKNGLEVKRTRPVNLSSVLSGKTQVSTYAAAVPLSYGNWETTIVAYVTPLKYKDMILGTPFTRKYADYIDHKHSKFVPPPLVDYVKDKSPQHEEENTDLKIKEPVDTEEKKLEVKELPEPEVINSTPTIEKQAKTDVNTVDIFNIQASFIPDNERLSQKDLAKKKPKYDLGDIAPADDVLLDPDKMKNVEKNKRNAILWDYVTKLPVTEDGNVILAGVEGSNKNSDFIKILKNSKEQYNSPEINALHKRRKKENLVKKFKGQKYSVIPPAFDATERQDRDVLFEEVENVGISHHIEHIKMLKC